MKSGGKKNKSALAVTASLWLTITAAHAVVPTFDSAVKMYQKGQYALALKTFERIGQSDPTNSDAPYYCALCKQQLRDYQGARQAYADVIRRFPGTLAAIMSGTALYHPSADSVAGGYRAQRPHVASRPSGPDPEVEQAAAEDAVAPFGPQDQVPEQTRLYYTKAGPMILIDCVLHNRSMKMIFDTGAATCLFGKNHLSEAGVPLSNRAPDTRTGGIGSTAWVPAWKEKIDLKIGQIYRHNFPVIIEDYIETPLLGQTFLRNFDYTIDESSQCITLTRKHFAAPKERSDTYTIPFERVGNHMVVVAEVNGHSCKFILDTGASTVVFTTKQMQSLGITIPEDAQQVSTTGVTGTTTSKLFHMGRLKLGPIDITGSDAQCLDDTVLDYPLLGQSCLGNWQLSVDDQAHQIHFVRR